MAGYHLYCIVVVLNPFCIYPACNVPIVFVCNLPFCEFSHFVCHACCVCLVISCFICVISCFVMPWFVLCSLSREMRSFYIYRDNRMPSFPRERTQLELPRSRTVRHLILSYNVSITPVLSPHCTLATPASWLNTFLPFWEMWFMWGVIFILVPKCIPFVSATIFSDLPYIFIVGGLLMSRNPLRSIKCVLSVDISSFCFLHQP